MKQDCCCPITQDVMKDPVIAADGHTYERTAIEHWFQEHQTSPMTNTTLPNKKLIPNWAVRKIIHGFTTRMKKEPSTPKVITKKNKRTWCREKYGSKWWDVDVAVKKGRLKEALVALGGTVKRPPRKKKMRPVVDEGYLNEVATRVPGIYM